MQEHPVPHIKAHMADPRRVVGAHKEHQIPRPRLGYRRGNVVEALRPQPPGIAQAAVGQNIADKAAAIKGGGRAAAAPHIRKAQILLRLCNQRRKVETDTWTDEEGNTHTDTYQVPYDYYICYVTLENFNLSHVPIYMMSEEQLSRYALYMATLGNRPDLFPQSGYVPRYTNPPPKHDVPEAYLADETFAAILKEAEKYLGFPYVWGGSSPSTSFDCSGFVSYVYNQCGWDFGRLGAQGLYNISTPTNNPKPGDLVFFTGTYDTPGVSHVGIYVGDGWMLDCGDPIHYSNLNTNYWQSHFYAYGKLY